MKKNKNQNEAETNEKIEEISEEKKTNEEQKAANDSAFMYINKEKHSDDFNMEESIEAARQELFKTYKSANKFNNISMIVVAAVFIVSFILITQQQTALTIVGYVLIGVTLVLMIVRYFTTRNLYPNKSKQYIKTFWQDTNNFIFDQPGFSDCYIDPAEVYRTIDISAERAYTGIIDSASRNIVHGKYYDKGFTFGELALYKAGQKKKSREVMFIGRHIDATNDYHFEGRYIVTIKSDKNLDLANDIGDLVVLHELGNFIIYGKEGAQYEKDLGKHMVSILKELEIKDPLLTINVVFWAGRTCIYLSYDDSIVAIPLEQKFSMDAYVSLKQDIKNVFKLILGDK